MWIMVAGPYSSGAADDERREANLVAMNRVAYALFLRGHIPIIGVNLALPIIQAAGPATFEAVMMPLSLAAAQRCDAILRVGGPSAGADREVAVFERAGKPVFRTLEEIPEPAADVDRDS